jgi:hypothetical protein
MPNTAQEQEQAFAKALLSQKAEADYHENVQFGGAAKQYVRMYGWLAYIKDFTKRRSEAGVTTPFKYFTLPGSNMTDIGVLWNAGLIKPVEGKVNIAICDKVHANWLLE